MFVFAQSAPLELNLHGFSNTSEKEFLEQLASGERFVVFHYAVSFILYTFQHPTKIRRVRDQKQALVRGLPWTLLTVLCGWWALPLGPMLAVSAITKNLKGGTDVSSEILEFIRSQDPKYQYGLR